MMCCDMMCCDMMCCSHFLHTSPRHELAPMPSLSLRRGKASAVSGASRTSEGEVLIGFKEQL